MNLVVKNIYSDSTIWNAVTARPTDIIIASCYKAGTTLTQQIVNLLINGNSEFSGYNTLQELSPWVEHTPDPLFASLEEKITHIEKLPDPRFLKTHLPFDALPYHPEWKYIYLVRDGRDVALSLYNHNAGYDPAFWDVKLEDSFLEFWDNWLETGRHLWPLWDHIDSWWQVRDRPNILLIHYANLIGDKENEIERIAEFLGVKMDATKKEIVMQQSSLEYMKEYADKFAPPGFIPKAFFGKGKNGVWKDLLTAEKLEKYEAFIIGKLGIECANWVKNGGSLPPLVEKTLEEAVERDLK
ncbi:MULTISPECIES: sulfotransferase domain-containing protein [Aerosakkonema]|uniref:sulfotransferase domain-containing protein n=1 Tax=Aerosakkonema TaxID=1246629 RepID=UPI0035B6D76F